MPPSRRVYVATFGCRTNQADSAAIRQQFLDSGFSETDCCEKADVIVVNSCTVTHRSDQQVRQLSRSLRRRNGRARLVVTGCYAQRSPGELAVIPGVDAVVGNSYKSNLVELALDPPPSPASRPELAAVYRQDLGSERTIDVTSAALTGGKTRPFVKVQDGCDARCAYCIIPQVRGPSRSVPRRAVLRQIEELIEAGFREIVLTGIHIGSYGLHLKPRVTLDGLVKDIVSLPGLGRVRLSSIEPMQLSYRIVELAAREQRIAPHFHICLQSGSDEVLRRMLRPYNTARFARIVERIRREIPDAAIGTDVIAGFPGETEGQHRETVDFIRSMPFNYLHVFPYSDRRGTGAFASSQKIPPPVVKRRSRELRELSDRKWARFRRRFLGRTLSLLTLTDEKQGKRLAVSGNYLDVRVDPAIPGNRLIQAVAEGEGPDHLLARVVESSQ